MRKRVREEKNTIDNQIRLNIMLRLMLLLKIQSSYKAFPFERVDVNDDESTWQKEMSSFSVREICFWGMRIYHSRFKNAWDSNLVSSWYDMITDFFCSFTLRSRKTWKNIKCRLYSVIELTLTLNQKQIGLKK